MFTLASEATGDTAVLRLFGELDLAECPALEAEISGHLIQGRSRIAVDLSNVRYIDSSGIRVLIEGALKIRAHSGELTLVAPSHPVIRILAVTGLLSYFKIDESAGDGPAPPFGDGPHPGPP